MTDPRRVPITWPPDPGLRFHLARLAAVALLLAATVGATKWCGGSDRAVLLLVVLVAAVTSPAVLLSWEGIRRCQGWGRYRPTAPPVRVDRTRPGK